MRIKAKRTRSSQGAHNIDSYRVADGLQWGGEEDARAEIQREDQRSSQPVFHWDSQSALNAAEFAKNHHRRTASGLASQGLVAAQGTLGIEIEQQYHQTLVESKGTRRNSH